LIGFESEKLQSLYWYLEKTQGHSIGRLPWTRYANTTLNHDKVLIYCALLTPQWKQSLRSSSMQGEETWSLKCSIARLDRLNRKFPPILIITEAKNVYFFVCKRTGFFHQELRDFVKITLIRVESFREKRDSSRVTIFSTWLESSPSHQKSWLESCRVNDWSHAITAEKNQSHLKILKKNSGKTQDLVKSSQSRVIDIQVE